MSVLPSVGTCSSCERAVEDVLKQAEAFFSAATRERLDAPSHGYAQHMIILGLVLMVLGLLLSIPILWTIGIVLVIVGAVLWLLGRSGRGVGGRAHYW